MTTYTFRPQEQEIDALLQSRLDVRRVEKGIALTLMDPESDDWIDGQIILTEQQVSTLIGGLLFLTDKDPFTAGYDEGHRDGYEQGYEAGWEVGNESGYDTAMMQEVMG